MDTETESPTEVRCSALVRRLEWEDHRDLPRTLRGYLPDDKGTTLFLIKMCEDKEDRGDLSGAFIPDVEDEAGCNSRILVSFAKRKAQWYLEDWLERMQPNDPSSPTRPDRGGERKGEQ